MTAIVGVLNKHAVAIAADSAVTLGGGRKVHNGANKLFSLSKRHPAAVAVLVISKGDGIIWMKRKHYFDAGKNHQFFSNYYNS